MNRNNVCVVMSSYNGEKYIDEQLRSIFNQKGVDLFVYVRDDGSKDSTVKVFNTYLKESFKLERGVNCGAKKSFLIALTNAPETEYYAFADQDDVWDDDKLLCAIKMIKEEERTSFQKPILYMCKTRLVDKNLALIEKKSSINESIVIHDFLKGKPIYAPGCTMVFNRALRNVIISYMPKVFPMHDAWIYIVCLAIGGKIIYDNVPHMCYRQHENNAVGGRRNVWPSIKRRIAFHLKMGSCYHTKMLKEIYDNFATLMPEKNITRYKFVASYNKSIINKIMLLKDKDFLKGDFKYSIENAVLVLFNLY